MTEMCLSLRRKSLNYDAQSNCSIRSGNSHWSKLSVASSTSTRAKLIEAKAESTALEVKAAFLKRKQELRMAAEELDPKQQIAEVKMEEQIYVQELMGNVDNCLKGVYQRENDFELQDHH